MVRSVEAGRVALSRPGRSLFPRVTCVASLWSRSGRRRVSRRRAVVPSDLGSPLVASAQPVYHSAYVSTEGPEVAGLLMLPLREGPRGPAPIAPEGACVHSARRSGSVSARSSTAAPPFHPAPAPCSVQRGQGGPRGRGDRSFPRERALPLLRGQGARGPRARVPHALHPARACSPLPRAPRPVRDDPGFRTPPRFFISHFPFLVLCSA